ncbi:energy-coupling factor ABC transporter ATP-binding protein [Haloquadratum walsbyi]|jgi:cobalt/nickel transport system ATP-binding protein|uniref:ABC-type transport system ATP-binding protein (Probable substrate cobalt) n=1 Tax=Haloquadratum walsbyi (strain DSM 16790 / HBSQ001) TaxID=362976 RepID=Q18J45_HALWD|nr:ABC transporter ATP-binding protein [Haloquadratum walsbyi]CAJ51966.1 ABC-type transport system ATP-binding protein (probable substrate cobalt) [Haloquadratum walsbyi DSM 16790]
MIELTEVQFAYDTESVLADVTLRVPKGSITVLLGRNGAGKSTLLRHCNGLLKPDSGDVNIDGSSLTSETTSMRAIRQRVGFIFQRPADQLVAPTVKQDVAFGPANWEKNMPPDDIDTIVTHALERVGLAGFEDRLCSRLSGGERKRVALAGVLAMDPEYIVADEPSAGLDGDGVRGFAELLKRLATDGIGVIVSTHYPDFASAVGDRFRVLEDGRIVHSSDQLESIPLREHGIRTLGTISDT